MVDSVGSHTLANACAQTRYGGAVAACGLAQGMDFPASVAPFILRGVSLLASLFGVDRRSTGNRDHKKINALGRAAFSRKSVFGRNSERALCQTSFRELKSVA